MQAGQGAPMADHGAARGGLHVGDAQGGEEGLLAEGELSPELDNVKHSVADLFISFPVTSASVPAAALPSSVGSASSQPAAAGPAAADGAIKGGGVPTVAVQGLGSEEKGEEEKGGAVGREPPKSIMSVLGLLGEATRAMIEGEQQRRQQAEGGALSPTLDRRSSSSALASAFGMREEGEEGDATSHSSSSKGREKGGAKGPHEVSVFASYPESPWKLVTLFCKVSSNQRWPPERPAYHIAPPALLRQHCSALFGQHFSPNLHALP